MNITSIIFVFLFLPITVIVHKLVPQKFRNPLLLVASGIFYWFASGKSLSCVLYLFAMTLITWMIGIHIKTAKEYENSPAPQLWAGIILNAVGLIFFKYIGCVKLPDNLGFMAELIVPLGISFFTFKNISYLHEIYSGTEIETNFIDYATYAVYFPQIMQGPIQTYKSAREELKFRTVSIEGISSGIERFIIGYGMKQIIAAKLMALYNTPMNWGLDAVSTPMAWLAVIAYSLCLYLDFYGYTLMANGISEMLGFTLCVNFSDPYISRSVSDFWRRWHVSLGAWFKENVYFPLGGSRVSVPRYLFNTLVVWLLTGIWHGTGLTFIFWGLLSYVLIVLEHISAKHEGPLFLLEKTKVASRLYIIVYILMSWALFMSPSISEYLELMKRLFPFWGTAEYVNNLDFIPYIQSCWLYIVAGILISTSLPSKLWKKIRVKPFFSIPILLVVLWVAVYFTAISGSNPFMYVNF